MNLWLTPWTSSYETRTVRPRCFLCYEKRCVNLFSPGWWRAFCWPTVYRVRRNFSQRRKFPTQSTSGRSKVKPLLYFLPKLYDRTFHEGLDSGLRGTLQIFGVWDDLNMNFPTLNIHYRFTVNILFIPFFYT